MDKIFELQCKVSERDVDETIILDNPDDYTKEIYDYLEKIKWLRPNFTDNSYVKENMKSATKGFSMDFKTKCVGIKYRKAYGEKIQSLEDYDKNLLFTLFSYDDEKDYLRELAAFVSYDYSSREFDLLNVDCTELSKTTGKRYYWSKFDENVKTK
jgi:hypothetical protein